MPYTTIFLLWGVPKVADGILFIGFKMFVVYG